MMKPTQLCDEPKSVGFAMQNSRFYRAKPTLLERKTIGFTIR